MPVHECPKCLHAICTACFSRTWANAKAPLVECCQCGTQNDRALWCNEKFKKSEHDRTD